MKIQRSMYHFHFHIPNFVGMPNGWPDTGCDRRVTELTTCTMCFKESAAHSPARVTTLASNMLLAKFQPTDNATVDPSTSQCEVDNLKGQSQSNDADLKILDSFIPVARNLRYDALPMKPFHFGLFFLFSSLDSNLLAHSISAFNFPPISSLGF